MREFSVKFRDHTKLICQEDKHTIKVGEPGLPVASVERGKSVLVAHDQIYQCADHDFTKFSLTPSVTFDSIKDRYMWVLRRMRSSHLPA